MRENCKTAAEEITPLAGAPLPAFVINLARSPERWDYMARHCRDRGFDVRRVAAVDGRDLTAAEIERLVLTTAGVRPIAVNEVACFESHKRAWQALLDSGAGWGLVAEDDIYLDSEAAAVCRAIAAVAPAAIVKLNAYVKPIYVLAAPMWQGHGHELVRPVEKTIDGSAYLISRAAAEAALARFAHYAEELDLALFDPATGFAVAQVCPALSVQQKFADFDFLEEAAQASTLEDGRAEVRSALKRARGRRTRWQAIRAEWRRFVRRRVRPRLMVVANLFRPPDQRLALVRIGFSTPDLAK